MCLSWVTLLVEIGFKPIQLNIGCAPVSSTENGYWGWKFLGTLFLLPTVGSRFRRNCSTSASANRKKNERIPLEHRSPQGFWTTERLPHVNAHFSLPSLNEPFILYTDASQFAIGAVLAHVQNSLERVNCYASKSLNKAQSRYSTIKRELLAIVNYTRHFKHYLLSRQLKIITDHRALQWVHNFKGPDALPARWLEKLAAFDYEIEHRSGKSIGHADCMSRLPTTTSALNMTATMDLDASVVG